jgi:hypothetical protein
LLYTSHSEGKAASEQWHSLVVFTVDMPWAWLLSSFSPATAGLTPKIIREVISVKLVDLMLPTLKK